MTRELQEKIQAWIDAELDAAEAGRIAALAQSDPAVRSLAENLRGMKTLVQDHPPERALDASRDFYWSQIRQGIERAERASGTAKPEATVTPPSFRWLAWLIPAVATVALALFALRPEALPGFETPDSKPSSPPVLVGHLVETPLPELTSVTFYSSNDAMTVVWVGPADIL